MLVAAFVYVPILVPVLPVSWGIGPTADVREGPSPAASGAETRPEAVDLAPLGLEEPQTVEAGGDSHQPQAAAAAPEGTASSGVAEGSLAAIRGVLFAVWVAGLAGLAGMVLWRAGAAGRWRRQCVLIKDRGILTLCEQIARRLGLVQPPVLFETESCQSPVVLGTLRTSVVLPSRLVAGSTPGQMRLILGHEIAHIRRWDLAWSWFSTFVCGLFFFHPLVWIAVRELRLAQEMACDELAVRQPDASVAEYGGLLVTLAAPVGSERVSWQRLVWSSRFSFSNGGSVP